MTLIKVKAKIYYYTGIYLAYKEESEYLQSKEFWKSMEKLLKSKDADFKKPVNAQGLLIGLWQAKHGFYRPYNIWTSGFRRLKWRIKACLTKKKSN
jgi:hypothetical protein